MFSSDKGAAIGLGEHGGSEGALRGGKAIAWEGGVREPFIARWCGRIGPGPVSTAVASTLDVFPTGANLSGAKIPKTLTLEGADLAPLRWESKSRPQPDFFYYNADELSAMRQGPWKLHFNCGPQHVKKTELYQIEKYISERFDVSAANPEKVAEVLSAQDHF